MKIELFRDVIVVEDLRDDDLKAGDMAVLVDYVPHPTGGELGAVLELFNALGESVRTAVVPVSAIAPVTANLIPTTRRLAA